MIVTVTASIRPSMWNNAAENIVRQTVKPDMAILVRHRTKADPNEWQNALFKIKVTPFVFTAPNEYELSDVLRMGYDIAANTTKSPGLISTMDDDDYYGDHYFEELAEAFKTHPNAAIIGKQSYWCKWMEPGKHVDLLIHAGFAPPPAASSVAGPTISVSMEAWRHNPTFRHPRRSLLHADSGLIAAATSLGLPIYTTSPSNFILQRYPASHGHGWNMPDPKD